MHIYLFFILSWLWPLATLILHSDNKNWCLISMNTTIVTLYHCNMKFSLILIKPVDLCAICTLYTKCERHFFLYKSKFFFATVFFEWVSVMCWHVHILSNWIVCSRCHLNFFYIFLFRWQQLLINSIVGYDTILTNSLVNSPGHGMHLILLCMYKP